MTLDVDQLVETCARDAWVTMPGAKPWDDVPDLIRDRVRAYVRGTVDTAAATVARHAAHIAVASARVHDAPVNVAADILDQLIRAGVLTPDERDLILARHDD